MSFREQTIPFDGPENLVTRTPQVPRTRFILLRPSPRRAVPSDTLPHQGPRTNGLSRNLLKKGRISPPRPSPLAPPPRALARHSRLGRHLSQSRGQDSRSSQALGVRKDLEVVATEEDLNDPELVIWPAHSTPRHPRKLGGHHNTKSHVLRARMDLVWFPLTLSFGLLWTSRKRSFSCFHAPLPRWDTDLQVLLRNILANESGKWVFGIVGNPSPEAWRRVHRYASWMRQINVGYLDIILEEEAVRQFRLGSPANGWFPALRVLDWVISERNLPYVDLLLSPHLEAVTISSPPRWIISRFPRDLLPTLASIFSVLPASTLQILHFSASGHDTPWGDLKNSFSSVVLGCGPSLAALVSLIPLSDAAVDHAIRLPHLNTWAVQGPPPNYTASSPPSVFPSLTQLVLGEAAGHGWLSLFQRLEDRVSATQSMTPLCRVEESLKSLSVDGSSTDPIVDISLISPIRTFRNLATLDVGTYCHDGRCGFKLSNDNVAELAMALPHLECLRLGPPCHENACDTTVACLLPISVRCLKLENLSIHFNTTNIVGDFKNIPVDPQLQELRSLPRCTLPCLDVREMPLIFEESDFETVADGLRDIFPSLRYCGNPGGIWDRLAGRIEEINARGTLSALSVSAALSFPSPDVSLDRSSTGEV